METKNTLLCVGPVSETVVRATFGACSRFDQPAVFIASRNQVDLRSLGYGYLLGGIDQCDFVKLIQKLREEYAFSGVVHICRDHGGPWQRNKELDEKYPLEKAMEIAKRSFEADIKVGFDHLHIDPTKCPFSHTLDDVCEWTIELLKFCEEKRLLFQKPTINYEVGTEDIQGGLTSEDVFEEFLEKLTKGLKERGLPLPLYIVAQTGTLVKMNRNVGYFDVDRSRKLVEIACKYGLNLKEHNTDYLNSELLRVHPGIGISAINVAPEFGFIETNAYLELEKLEKKFVREGRLSSGQLSNLEEVLLNLTWKKAPWYKWVTQDIKKMSLENIRTNSRIRSLILRVCGHYVYSESEFVNARIKLCNNLSFVGMKSVIQFAIDRVQTRIERYFKCLRQE